MSRRTLWWGLVALVALGCNDDVPAAAEPGAGGSGGDVTGGTATADVATTSAAAGGETTSVGGGGVGGVDSVGCEQHADRWLCDDFEAGSIDPSRWETSVRFGSTVEVTSERAREGMYGLHVHLPSTNGANGLIRALGLGLPLPNNSLYGRAWVYVEGEFPPQHSRLISASGDLDGETAAYRLDVNQGELNSRYFTRHIHDNVQHGGLKKFGHAMPLDTWMCIEWHYDGVQNGMRYWFDGSLVPTMTVDGSESPLWEAPIFGQVELGWHAYQGGAGDAQGYDVFYDAVVLDAERIGCGQ